MIFSLGRLLVARFTGEDLLGRQRPGNPFDALFMRTVMMAWLVFAIAIPFFRIEPTSLPLTVGILAGLMWLPFGWMIQHWVGTFHAVTRTVLCIAGAPLRGYSAGDRGRVPGHDRGPRQADAVELMRCQVAKLPSCQVAKLPSCQ
jgi:hypothetical protein